MGDSLGEAEGGCKQSFARGAQKARARSRWVRPGGPHAGEGDRVDPGEGGSQWEGQWFRGPRHRDH